MLPIKLFLALIFHFLIFFQAASVSATDSSTESDLEKILNYCISGKNHKSKPGPEDSLHQHCTPWKEHACCTTNTTVDVHNVNMYGFSYDHCGRERRMSDTCRRHFTQDLCFYECSPDIGPWVQKVDMKIRKERYYKVPLCATDCDAWFHACENDYTCTDNWTRNFKWVDGSNQCPQGSTCRTFKEIFLNASNFCERVWDDSWKYTADSEPCMRIWFDGTKGNPNAAVARWKAIQQLNAAGIITPYHHLLLSLILVAILHF